MCGTGLGSIVDMDEKAVPSVLAGVECQAGKDEGPEGSDMNRGEPHSNNNSLGFPPVHVGERVCCWADEGWACL